jgi:hypothetical protein
MKKRYAEKCVLMKNGALWNSVRGLEVKDADGEYCFSVLSWSENWAYAVQYTMTIFFS